MKDKIEQLAHIDRLTRKEVLRWCREYEIEIEHLKRQCEMFSDVKQVEHDTEIAVQRALCEVGKAVGRTGHCTLFFSVFGKFKVLTQEVRIIKERRGSTWVGNYSKGFIQADLLEDIMCALKEARNT